MNKLETLLARFECGFITSPGLLAELVTLDRLHPVLVRCGGGRFTCGAQDVEHFTRCVDKGGDYVRDISLPAGSAERAAQWVPECPHPLTATAMMPASPPPQAFPNGRWSPSFNESDCGGVYDGFGTVTSDADSGL